MTLGEDEPDARGRSGLHLTGRDLARNPDVRVLDVELVATAWHVLRRTTFEQRDAAGAWVRKTAETYDRGNGATILLYDLERRTVLLTRQFRYPVYVNDHTDGMLIEAAAGLLDDDAPEAAIRREAIEETGHEVGELEHVFDVYMSPGSVTERLHFYAAPYSAETARHAGGGLTDEGEQIEVSNSDIDDAVARIGDEHRRREDDHAAAVGGADRSVPRRGSPVGCGHGVVRGQADPLLHDERRVPRLPRGRPARRRRAPAAAQEDLVGAGHHLAGRRRRRPLLRLDRRPGRPVRRRLHAAGVHPAAQEQPVVADQPGSRRAAIAEGRMRAGGQAEVERAKADGRWDAAYRMKDAGAPDDLQAAIDASPAASAAWQTLTKQNRFAIIFRTTSVKRAETRERKIGEYVAMLERGETIY